MTKIVIQGEYCKGCGFCIDACRKNVLAIGGNANGRGYHYVVAAHPENCVGCTMCATVCPDAAIELYKEE